MGWLWRLLAGWCCPARVLRSIGRDVSAVRRARLGDWLLSRPFQ